MEGVRKGGREEKKEVRKERWREGGKEGTKEGWTDKFLKGDKWGSTLRAPPSPVPIPPCVYCGDDEDYPTHYMRDPCPEWFREMSEAGVLVGDTCSFGEAKAQWSLPLALGPLGPATKTP